MSNVAAKLNKAGVKKLSPQKKKLEPLWDGPESNTPQGGITQSILGSWLVCRERARIRLIDGLRPPDGFSKHLEFGSMWHISEEAFAAGEDWVKPLQQYASELCRRYPLDQSQVDQWYNVVKIQFPVYISHWKKHEKGSSRTGIFQEQTFNVPYVLPSGRVVRLRGKFDGADLIGTGKQVGVYLFETKTKSDIEELLIQRQLTRDLQTMIYIIALQQFQDWDHPIKGVRYNVVRRPLSGGKGSIRQHKPTKSNPQGETKEQFYQRLLNDYIAPEPGYWFMRWISEVTKTDIERFKTQFLNPTLETVCQWYDWVTSGDPWREGNTLHHLHPFGVYNSLIEYGSSDVDEYILSDNSVGLQRAGTLFQELE